MEDFKDKVAREFVEDLTDYAVVIVDNADRILIWNAGARLFGYSPAEAIGGSFRELFSKLDPTMAETTASILDAAKGGRHESNRELVRKDGTRFQANLVLRTLVDSGNNVLGFSLIAHDIDRSRRIAAAFPAGAATGACPNARILVVNDNPGVLGIATDQLTSLGYRVTTAANGDEALEVLNQGTEIDLLFTDVVMPGDLAGRALAAKARELRPGLKVLFASGYFEGTLVGKGQLDADVQFLPKPYLKQELAEKLQEVLGTVPKARREAVAG